jgi:hypothetical protein
MAVEEQSAKIDSLNRSLSELQLSVFQELEVVRNEIGFLKLSLSTHELELTRTTKSVSDANVRIEKLDRWCSEFQSDFQGKLRRLTLKSDGKHNKSLGDTKL